MRASKLQPKSISARLTSQTYEGLISWYPIFATESEGYEDYTAPIAFAFEDAEFGRVVLDVGDDTTLYHAGLAAEGENPEDLEDLSDAVLEYHKDVADGLEVRDQTGYAGQTGYADAPEDGVPGPTDIVAAALEHAQAFGLLLAAAQETMKAQADALNTQSRVLAHLLSTR